MNLHPLSEENEADTVCGGRIEDPNQYPSALYHGERVYFCTRACLRNSLIRQKGVLDAHVDHLRGEAKVVFNPDLVTVADLLEAVKRAGDDGRHEYRAVLEELKGIP